MIITESVLDLGQDVRISNYVDLNDYPEELATRVFNVLAEEHKACFRDGLESVIIDEEHFGEFETSTGTLCIDYKVPYMVIRAFVKYEDVVTASKVTMIESRIMENGIVSDSVMY